MIKNIPSEWLENPNLEDVNVVDTIINDLVKTKKVPRYSYNIFQDACTPDKRYEYWNDKVNVPADVAWRKVHISNFKCSIDTRLHSFYFKFFS